MRRRLMMQSGLVAHNLPPEYQEVKHITPYGNSWFNFNVKFNNNTYSLLFETIINKDPSGKNNNVFLYGSWRSGYNTGLGLLLWYNGFVASNQGWYGSSLPNKFNNLPQEYTIYHDFSRIEINGVNYEITSSPNNLDIYILNKSRLSKEVPNWDGEASLKAVSMMRGENVIRETYPCYRKSDNEPGMYDIVNGVFYTNQGNGEFIVGKDVN